MKKTLITTLLVTIMCITHTNRSADLNEENSFHQLPPVEQAKIQFNMLQQQLKAPYFREEKETTWGGQTTHLLNEPGRKRLKVIVAKIKDLHFSNPALSSEERSQIQRMAFDALALDKY